MTRPVPIEPPMAICGGGGGGERGSLEDEETATHHRDLPGLQATVQVFILADALVNLAVVGSCGAGRLALVDAAAAVEALLRVDLLVLHRADGSFEVLGEERARARCRARSE